MLSLQRKYFCINNHCMHHGCFNKFGAERQRHAINNQMLDKFRVSCPLCNSDETNRLTIEHSIVSHLTNTKDTESFERDEEQSISVSAMTNENDPSYNLNPHEDNALHMGGISCFCCKLLILDDQAHQQCLLCERILHSDPCFETEYTCVKALKLTGVCHGKSCFTYLWCVLTANL